MRSFVTITLLLTLPITFSVVANAESPWGRLFHDASAVTIEEAISRHGGQAIGAREAYERLTETERRALIEFLKSL